MRALESGPFVPELTNKSRKASFIKPLGDSHSRILVWDHSAFYRDCSAFGLPASPVPSLAGRFRCTRCGSRETEARPEFPSAGRLRGYA